MSTAICTNVRSTFYAMAVRATRITSADWEAMERDDAHRREREKLELDALRWAYQIVRDAHGCVVSDFGIKSSDIWWDDWNLRYRQSLTPHELKQIEKLKAGYRRGVRACIQAKKLIRLWGEELAERLREVKPERATIRARRELPPF